MLAECHRSLVLISEILSVTEFHNYRVQISIYEEDRHDNHHDHHTVLLPQQVLSQRLRLLITRCPWLHRVSACFDTYLAFLRCNEFTDFTAKVIFHLGFSPFCLCFCFGKIDFPKCVGNTISRTNTIATGVKPSPWTCFLMSFQKVHHLC